MSDLIGDVPDVDGSPLRVCVDGPVLTLGRPGQPLWRLGTGERDLLLRLLMRGEFQVEAVSDCPVMAVIGDEWADCTLRCGHGGDHAFRVPEQAAAPGTGE